MSGCQNGPFSELRVSLTFVSGFLDSSVLLVSITVRFCVMGFDFVSRIGADKKSTAISDHLRSDHDMHSAT